MGWKFDLADILGLVTSPADPKAVMALPAWVAGKPVPPEARLGKVLQNEFHLLRVIGDGELGVTYEAENARLKGKFAVLMLRRELAPTQGMVLAVQKDLRAAQPLQSLGLLPVKMLVDQFDIPGFATELLDGETLRQRLRRGPLSVERAVAIVSYVAKALDALHKAGAVHGDLRPENIFLVRPGAKSSFAGKVVIVEHALYHLRRRTTGLDDKLPLYKLMYRPPELLAGLIAPHPGGDVFVLGAILHECLTGQPAFFAEVEDFVLDKLHEPPKKLQPNPSVGLSADVCLSLDDLIACACAPKHEERLPDMVAFGVALSSLSKKHNLKLPAVLTENKGEADDVVQDKLLRMHQLLERRSGIFPVIGPIAPVTSPTSALSSVSAPAPALSSVSAPQPAPPTVSASPGPSSIPNPAKFVEPPSGLLSISAPKKKVTQILERMSSAFPVLTVSPDSGSIQEQLVQPMVQNLPQAAAVPEVKTLVGCDPTPLQPLAEKNHTPDEPVVGKPVAQQPVLQPLSINTVEPVKSPPKTPEVVASISYEAPTQPRLDDAKPVLKASVAEVLARLKKPAAPVELKGPEPLLELPFAPSSRSPNKPVPPPGLAADAGPLSVSTEAATAILPPKTAPPIQPSETVVGSETDKVRKERPTVQLDNLADLLVVTPSLTPDALSALSDGRPASAELAQLPTQAVVSTAKSETAPSPELLAALTQPLLPAMLGELLTPAHTPALSPELTPAQARLHEAPTQAKLPSLDSMDLPSLQELPADQPPTVQGVQMIPAEAFPSAKIGLATGPGLHEQPTSAVIPNNQLLTEAGRGAEQLLSPILNSDPIRRPETSPLPKPVPATKSEQKVEDALKEVVVPPLVSTVHSSFAPKPPVAQMTARPPKGDPTVRELLLRHQELVAAGAGALLVLGLGLLFYMLIR